MTLKSPVKKNSKETATYFVDIELPKVAKNFMDWVSFRNQCEPLLLAIMHESKKRNLNKLGYCWLLLEYHCSAGE